MKWNVPARTSAPSTESPMISAAIGIISPKIASAATLAYARVGVSSMAWTSRPKSSAPAHGMAMAIHRFIGTHERSV